MDNNSHVLSESDKFYIENNVKASLDELVVALKKGKELIKSYLLILEQKEHTSKKKKGDTPLLKSIYRKAGAVAMTKESTELSEEIAKIPTEPTVQHSHRGLHGKDILPIRKV